MTDETTPLTASASNAGPGPSSVFPGGVSPRYRRRKMMQFQWCIGLTFLVILVAALVFVLLLTDAYSGGNDKVPVLLLAANETNKTTIQQQLESTRKPIADEREAEWELKHVRTSGAKRAISDGIKALGDRELLEELLQPIPVNTPAFRHYRALSSDAESRKLSHRGYVENQATQRVAQLYNYTKSPERSNIGRGPPIHLQNTLFDLNCNFNSRYRRINGVCNSKMHPRSYGAALIPFRRMVAPDYADGILLPRASHNNGTQLPSAREVSYKIYRSSYETDSNFTVMLAVFGQFLDHDITATALTSAQEGESINCCTVPLSQHPECFPVLIHPDDPYYGKYNVSCMNFVRSAPAPTGRFGPRQQLNQATAFIDGSVVYSNTDFRQAHLRTHMNGTLRMYTTSEGYELLPISINPDDGCNRERMTREGKYCFESGDDRANENLLLTSMHLLWARHHNYLARGLQAINPEWDDETVFQEARKVLSAQMAHITYNEFLPILLGRDLADKKGLLPNKHDLDAADTYDPLVNPSIANCFAGAAFRFAHTLLPGLLNMTSDNSTPEAVELHKMLFNPFSLWSGHGIDSALLAAANTPVQRVDPFVSVELTQKLFETAEDNVPICGLDLVSLNIQRGRDHGLPAYPVFRRHCQLPSVDTWEEMANAVDPAALRSIQDIYQSPDDVDLYTGALSEPPLEGAIFGPLLACLVSDQFLRLKLGDSHWYERKIGPQKFTKDQLSEIYKTTLAEIICRNSDAIEQIHTYVMDRRSDAANVLANCSDIESFNFEPWTYSEFKPQLFHASFSRADTLVRVLNGVSDKPNRGQNSTKVPHKISKSSATGVVQKKKEEKNQKK